MQNPNCKYGGLCGKSECITILLITKKTRPLLVAACGCNGMKNYCTICWDAKSSYICIANIFVVFTRKKNNYLDVSKFCKLLKLAKIVENDKIDLFFH